MAENNLIETGRLVYSKGHLIGARSGALTGLAANAIVGAIRNAGPAELIVDSVDMAFYTTTPGSVLTAGVAFAFYKVAQFTVMGSTGARAAAPVPVRKRTLDHQLLLAAQPSNPSGKDDTFAQVQVGGTAAVTGHTIGAGGVVPVPDDPSGVLVCQPVNVSATFVLVQFNGQSRWDPKNWIPITLGPDEGIVFSTQLAFPASLAGVFSFCADAHIA